LGKTVTYSKEIEAGEDFGQEIVEEDKRIGVFSVFG